MRDPKQEIDLLIDEAMSSGAGLCNAPKLTDFLEAIGFTQDDVRDLRAIAASHQTAVLDASGKSPADPEVVELAQSFFRHLGDKYANLADRIEALLPPKT